MEEPAKFPFSIGAKVKDSELDWYGIGVIVKIAKSGVRAMVAWPETRKHLGYEVHGYRTAKYLTKAD